MTQPRATTILLYGDSGDGKSTQIGVLAEDVFVRTGKKTRLYCADPGGWSPIQPYVNLGVIEPVACLSYPRPWEWTMGAIKGKIPDSTGKWVLDEAQNRDIGVYAFDGYTGMADILMQDLARKASEGTNIGGQAPATKFTEGDVKVAGNSPAHYGNVQTQLTMMSQDSFNLPAEFVVWTALARRASDNDTNAAILGPQIVGKALTSEVPRWFVYTFRLMAVPTDPITKAPGRHTLIMEDHTDITMPGAKGLGNSRVPLDSPVIEPVTPANLVVALKKIAEASSQAEGVIKERMARAMGVTTG